MNGHFDGVSLVVILAAFAIIGWLQYKRKI